MTFDGAQTGDNVVPSFEGATYTIPESYSDIPGFSEAARALQEAIAEDTTDLESWLTGQSKEAVEATNRDGDSNDDLIDRAEAEIQAAIQLIDVMLLEPMGENQASELRDLRDRLHGALGDKATGHMGSLVALAAEMRSGRTSISAATLREMDFAERRRQIAEQIEEAYEEANKRSTALAEFMTEKQKDREAELVAAVEAENVGSDARVEAQIALAEYRIAVAQDVIARHPDNAEAEAAANASIAAQQVLLGASGELAALEQAQLEQEAALSNEGLNATVGLDLSDIAPEPNSSDSLPAVPSGTGFAVSSPRL